MSIAPKYIIWESKARPNIIFIKAKGTKINDYRCIQGGEGILLSGVPGVAPAEVVILGGGVVGTNAAKMASGLGAQVTILDVNLDRLAKAHNFPYFS